MESIKQKMDLPSEAKVAYHQGEWYTFADWNEKGIPAMKFKHRLYIMFTSRYLHNPTSGKYTYFLVCLSVYERVAIITEMYYLNNAQKIQPYKMDAKKYFKENAYLEDLPVDKTYYITNCESHSDLLSKISSIINKRTHLTPLDFGRRKF